MNNKEKIGPELLKWARFLYELYKKTKKKKQNRKNKDSV